MRLKNKLDERGAVLITSLVILVILTLIGIAGTNTSTLETIISGTERSRTEAFYAAEAGIEHLRRNFKSLFIQGNTNKFAMSQPPDWDFVLNGSQPGTLAATSTDFAGGVRWITDGDLSTDYLYNVTVWNNDDGGGPTNDTDAILFMRAEAQVPNGGLSRIEVSLFGGAGGSSGIDNYDTQDGGGSGKNYNSNDSTAITDFTIQSN